MKGFTGTNPLTATLDSSPDAVSCPEPTQRPEPTSHRKSPTANRPSHLALLPSLVFSLLLGLVTVGCAQNSLSQTPSSPALELHFLDVGQGDSVFIKAPSGQGVLYDGGRRSQAPLAYLQARGVTRVDLVIASHQDADHIAGLAAVVDFYRPKFFLDNGIPHTTQTYLGNHKYWNKNWTLALINGTAIVGYKLSHPALAQLFCRVGHL